VVTVLPPYCYFLYHRTPTGIVGNHYFEHFETHRIDRGPTEVFSLNDWPKIERLYQQKKIRLGELSAVPLTTEGVISLAGLR
jgi:hypothetical protein